jgi:hypothetical protein
MGFFTDAFNGAISVIKSIPRTVVKPGLDAVVKLVKDAGAVAMQGLIKTIDPEAKAGLTLGGLIAMAPGGAMVQSAIKAAATIVKAAGGPELPLDMDVLDAVGSLANAIGVTKVKGRQAIASMDKILAKRCGKTINDFPRTNFGGQKTDDGQNIADVLAADQSISEFSRIATMTVHGGAMASNNTNAEYVDDRSMNHRVVDASRTLRDAMLSPKWWSLTSKVEPSEGTIEFIPSTSGQHPALGLDHGAQIRYIAPPVAEAPSMSLEELVATGLYALVPGQEYGASANQNYLGPNGLLPAAKSVFDPANIIRTSSLLSIRVNMDTHGGTPYQPIDGQVMIKVRTLPVGGVAGSIHQLSMARTSEVRFDPQNFSELYVFFVSDHYIGGAPIDYHERVLVRLTTQYNPIYLDHSNVSYYGRKTDLEAEAPAYHKIAPDDNQTYSLFNVAGLIERGHRPDDVESFTWLGNIRGRLQKYLNALSTLRAASIPIRPALWTPLEYVLRPAVGNPSAHEMWREFSTQISEQLMDMARNRRVVTSYPTAEPA